MSKEEIRKQISEDLAKMLNAGVTDEGVSSLFSKPYSWWWHGQKSKPKQYKHNLYWSLKAYTKWTEQQSKKKPFDSLRYEHVVPVSTIGRMICQLRSPGKMVSPANIFELLEKFCIVCVIHQDEEKTLKPYTRKMPVDWDGCDVWARYKCAKVIEVGFLPSGLASKWQSYVFPFINKKSAR